MVSWHHALTFVNDLAFSKRGKRLGEAEIKVLEAAWGKYDYKQAAENSRYTQNYLQRTVAPKLWKFLDEELAEELGVEEKLDKNLFRSAIEQVVLGEKLAPSLFDPELGQQSILGSQPPEVHKSIGRDTEVEELHQAIQGNRCVILTGIQGIGKSTLASKLVRKVSSEGNSRFDSIIWQSAYYPLEDFIKGLMITLDLPQKDIDPRKSLQTLLSSLLIHLRQESSLIVIDNLETLLKRLGDSQPDFDVFIRRIIEENHRGCFVLISRQPLNGIELLQSSGLPVSHKKIDGLDLELSVKLLESEGISVKKNHYSIIDTFLGNPYVLKCAADKVKRFYSGNLDNIISNKTSLGSNILEESFNESFVDFDSLSKMEKKVLLVLAQEAEKSSDPIAFSLLISQLNTQEIIVSESDLIAAIESLERLCPIEIIPSRPGSEASFTLQPMFRKYVIKNSHRITGEVNHFSHSPPT
ncbi:AAA family ATPase [Acaryochloris sp. CCMEE 5410]|uniref:AAA family ATPase n=1 Tax=Acaryochloris sp. CCMEE 5410 TaxID=310037 RepID=UPI0002484843|nr:AAA family ATPase [Acaryochloris sp. CCMEE 5410]KAI9129588.1 AAA family ATPase [Acaryochloris sp. CCMEE 5410]